jgi:hypothetical protein
MHRKRLLCWKAYLPRSSWPTRPTTPIICASHAAKGSFAVIPNPVTLKYPLDKYLYAQRHLMECSFSKLKQFNSAA